MTVVLEDTRTTAEETSPNAFAPWRVRAGAFAVDVLPLAAVAATMALVSLSVPAQGAWWWLCICVAGVVILLMLANRLLLPAVTGWSLGRALAGISLARKDGQAIGPWGLLLRDLAHLLDTVSVVGWLWPLWDPQRRTFADMLLHTRVRRMDDDQSPPGVRRWTAVAVLVATALCLAGAALSYLAVYSPERASDHARQEISRQGPKIVAEMLTYDPKSLHEDFARALSLTTDNYRGQLAAQQDVVQKGNPVINEYRVTDWSVETAQGDRATMLMFLQGRRGVPPDERYISATVRVVFVKGGDQWRVDNLTVLTKPRPPGAGK